MVQQLDFHPLTPDRWDDLETLFGPEKGADGGCWCMWWRITRSEWSALGKDRRKAVFKRIVEVGAVPGILAYHGPRPVGWCAIAPRRETPGLERSPVARRVDDAEVWSITCFYVDPAHRRGATMAALIGAAVEHAARAGATTVEAYPKEAERKTQPGDLFVGVASTFRRCGFVEVARNRPARPIMRRSVA